MYDYPSFVPEIGSQAPDFNLDGVLHSKYKRYSLKDYKGKWLVIFFYPLLSDFQRTMINNYGVHKMNEGVAYRGTFIIDPKGTVRHITISDNDVGRSVAETLRVVKALQTGKLCPAEWQSGDKTLN